MTDLPPGPTPGQPVPAGGEFTGQPATGHDGVDGALAALAAVAHLPPAEQMAAFDEAHQRLSATLHGIDDD